MVFKGLIFELGNTLMYFDGNWSEVADIADAAMVENLVNAGCDLDQDRFAQDFRDRLNVYYIEREHEFVELTTAHILKTLLADYGYPSVSEDVVERALAEEGKSREDLGRDAFVERVWEWREQYGSTIINQLKKDFEPALSEEAHARAAYN